MHSPFESLLALFFPRCCEACGSPLVLQEETICLSCEVKLPRTRLHDVVDNRLEKMFWGRADIAAATAFLRMPRHGMVHQLIHNLKYNHQPEVGVKLGQLLGLELQKSQRMNQFDIIIPVPLHPIKQRVRGYNQCACIAEGIGNVMSVDVSIDNLVRTKNSSTQTRKRRFNRWENVSEIFELRFPDDLKHKHALLVDDVITTGATIEACARLLNRVEGLKLSVASLAVPQHH